MTGCANGMVAPAAALFTAIESTRFFVRKAQKIGKER